METTLVLKKLVTLRCLDGVDVEAEESIAIRCKTIKNAVELELHNEPIPLPLVKSKILKKVIRYCKKDMKYMYFLRKLDKKILKNDGRKWHENYSKRNKRYEKKRFELEVFMRGWEANFCKKVNLLTLYDIINAANYLNVPRLLDLGCVTVADMIKGKTVEEIRETFNIVNDYTPVEEAWVREEISWAFE